MKKTMFAFISAKAGLFSLLVTVILVGLGERIGERFLPVYLVASGASLFAPSVLNALDNFLSALYSFPGGWISSRFGYKKALLWFNLFAVAGYGIVIVFPGWVAVLIGSVFFLSWSSLSMPACMDLIKHEVPKNKQVMGVSLHSVIKRVPMALGPVIGGVIIDRFGITAGIRLCFIAAAVLGIAAIVLQQLTLPDSVKPAKKAEEFPRILPNQFPRSMQVLLAADILAKFCSQILYAYVAVWAMETAGGARVTASQFGILSMIEMVCAIFVYVPAGLFGDRFSKKGFIQSTFVLYALFPAVFFCARSFPFLIVAFVIRGFKEFGEPVRKTQILDFAPDGEEALYFGAYYFYRDIIVTLGVFLGGALWVIHPALCFAAAELFGISAVVLYGVKGRSGI